MKKHAYLIMAHNEWEQLKILMKALDDSRADIYLHIDKKCKNCPIDELVASVIKSNIYIIPRIKVVWGGVFTNSMRIKSVEKRV